MKIVDANILLYAANPAAPDHIQCRAWLEDALNGDETIALDWIVVIAFLRISTLRFVFARPLSVSEAIEQMTEWQPNQRFD